MNHDFLAVTGHQLEHVVGRRVLEAFPANPAAWVERAGSRSRGLLDSHREIISVG